MQPRWFVIIIIFLIGFILELLLRSSGLVSLALVRPSSILFAALLSVTGYWVVNPAYIFFSVFADFAQYRIVGLAALSFYLSYLVVKFVNSIINLMGEAKYFFGLFVLALSYLLEVVLSQLLTGVEIAADQVLGLILITILYSVSYFLINKFFSPNVFKR